MTLTGFFAVKILNISENFLNQFAIVLHKQVIRLPLVIV